MSDVARRTVALYDVAVAHRLYDEVVTEREHALQCAAHASSAGAPPELVAAALLHDIGHLLLDDNVGLDEDLTVDHHHDVVGARVISPGGSHLRSPLRSRCTSKRSGSCVPPSRGISMPCRPRRGGVSSCRVGR